MHIVSAFSVKTHKIKPSWKQRKRIGIPLNAQQKFPDKITFIIYKVPRMTRQDNKNFIKTTCSGDHFHKDKSAWSKQKPELITSAQLDNDMYRFASLQNDIEVLTRKIQ